MQDESRVATYFQYISSGDIRQQNLIELPTDLFRFSDSPNGGAPFRWWIVNGFKILDVRTRQYELKSAFTTLKSLISAVEFGEPHRTGSAQEATVGHCALHIDV